MRVPQFIGTPPAVRFGSGAGIPCDRTKVLVRFVVPAILAFAQLAALDKPTTGADWFDPPSCLIESMVDIAAKDPRALRILLDSLQASPEGRFAVWQLRVAAALRDAIHGNQRDELLAAEALKDLYAFARTEVARKKPYPFYSTDELLAAIALLPVPDADFASDLDTLERILGPVLWLEAVGDAALASLARTTDASVPQRLLKRCQFATRSDQQRYFEVLASREEWTSALLDALARHELQPSQLDAARRQRLSELANPDLRARAIVILRTGDDSNRQAVLEEYSSVVDMPANSEQGRAVFLKRCGMCHQFGGVGHAVGPSLAALTNRTPQSLLIDLLDPNRAIEDKYVNYVATTDEEFTHTGILARETASSVTLVGHEGRQTVIARTRLEGLRATGKSLMPEGLERDLSRQELADLLCFVATNPLERKQLEGSFPWTIRENPQIRGLILEAEHAEIFGNQIDLEGYDSDIDNQIIFGEPDVNIGNWRNESDFVAWTVELGSAGEFDVILDWACDDVSAGSRFILEGTSPPILGVVETTGGWQNYKRVQIGTVRLDPGEHRLVFKPAGPLKAATFLDLKEIFLRPAALPADLGPGMYIPEILANRILDVGFPEEARLPLVDIRPEVSESLVLQLARNVPPGDEEYRRIPWIWRVAIATGRRNQPGELRDMLKAALPDEDEPLRDWQAVVVGGGLINGLSQLDLWPGERLESLLLGPPRLFETRFDTKVRDRWQRGLTLALAMADDESVPTGTRYDALRWAALADDKTALAILTRYLPAETNGELQMGAVSGLSDVKAEAAGDHLVAALAYLKDTNRGLAIDALLRTRERAMRLKQAIAEGTATAEELTPEQRAPLAKLTR